MTIRALAALALGALAMAGARIQDDPVRWTAEVALDDLAPGARAVVLVKAVIEKGWYIYSITQEEGGPVPSRISLGPDRPFTLVGDPTGPRPKVRFDRNFSMKVEVHEGSVVYEVPVQVSGEAAAGDSEIPIRARYQACTDRICLPPQTEEVSIPVTITPQSGP